MQGEEGAVILQQSNSLASNIISLVFMLPDLLFIHYFAGTIVGSGYQGFRWSLQTVMNVPGIPYVL